jgi:hypothetical protein
MGIMAAESMQASDFVHSLTPSEVKKIPDIIRSLAIVICDNCKKEKASFDAYIDSDMDNVKFLKRLCNNCLKLTSVSDSEHLQ